VVIYALETPPEYAIVIHVHCPLTEREREILQAILSTGSVKSAAAKLGLSINTVHKHLRHMLASFNVRSTLQLIAIALQKGFIRWEDEPSAEPRSRLVHQKREVKLSPAGDARYEGEFPVESNLSVDGQSVIYRVWVRARDMKGNETPEPGEPKDGRTVEVTAPLKPQKPPF